MMSIKDPYLALLLFIIYLNDIANTSNLFNFIIYSDDTTLSTTIEVILNNDDVESKINSKIACINDWLKCNNPSLNISKCKYMIFHMPQQKKPFPPKC